MKLQDTELHFPVAYTNGRDEVNVELLHWISLTRHVRAGQHL